MDKSAPPELRQIVERLSQPVSLKLDDYMRRMVSDGKSDHELALQELFAWICSQPNLTSILMSHNQSPESLDGIYSLLVVFGAGQQAGGSFVSAASLTQEHTLNYLLDAAGVPLPEGWSEGERWPKICFNLVEHFRIGKPLGAGGRL